MPNVLIIQPDQSLKESMLNYLWFMGVEAIGAYEVSSVSSEYMDQFELVVIDWATQQEHLEVIRSRMPEGSKLAVFYTHKESRNDFDGMEIAFAWPINLDCGRFYELVQGALDGTVWKVLPEKETLLERYRTCIADATIYAALFQKKTVVPKLQLFFRRIDELSREEDWSVNFQAFLDGVVKDVVMLISIGSTGVQHLAVDTPSATISGSSPATVVAGMNADEEQTVSIELFQARLAELELESRTEFDEVDAMLEILS